MLSTDLDLSVLSDLEFSPACQMNKCLSDGGTATHWYNSIPFACCGHVMDKLVCTACAETINGIAHRNTSWGCPVCPGIAYTGWGYDFFWAKPL